LAPRGPQARSEHASDPTSDRDVTPPQSLPPASHGTCDTAPQAIPPPPPDDITLVLAFRDHLAREISHLESQTEDLSTLEASLAPLEAEARKLAAELSALRRKASTKLAKEVEAALADLGMERARFSVELAPASDLTPTGLDVVDFIVATNPGLPASPLRKVASGGELSRVMLALKGILAAGDRVSVLVFDEIDANVGGRLGAIIGSKLRALAAGHQVLCITHLPQIAAYADRHLTVRKSQSKDATTSTVRPIEGEDRISELAEMIGGHTLTPTTRAQAQELLSSAASPPRAFPYRASAPSPTRASAPTHTPPSINSGGGGSDPAATLSAPTATPVKNPARRKVG
jgi:hypothetical protein